MSNCGIGVDGRADKEADVETANLVSEARGEEMEEVEGEQSKSEEVREKEAGTSSKCELAAATGGVGKDTTGRLHQPVNEATVVP